MRDFRNYERAEIDLAERLTVVVGFNGAGKTNLLEAVYVGCRGRSPRTVNDRELLRHGSGATRVTVTTEDEEGTTHLIEVGFTPGSPKSLRVDGAAVDGLSASPASPLVSAFLPERLALVKGGPSGRRAHLDHLVAALWPSRADVRTAYARVLAQRNALLARVRRGQASTASLASWDAELARHGAQLMQDRRRATDLLGPHFAARAGDLGLPAQGRLSYRPRSSALDAATLATELRSRHAADLERGFTAHGPHRDDFDLLTGETRLRTYGSQGQQRVALLALLFAERDLILAERDRAPLMLLDDVMSELDAVRRELLAELLRSDGQGLVTATDLDQVPGGRDSDVAVVEVADGALAAAAART